MVCTSKWIQKCDLLLPTTKIYAEDHRVIDEFENDLRIHGHKTFYVLDNGGKPFKVDIIKRRGRLDVTYCDNESDDDPRVDRYVGFSTTIKDVDEVWIGCGTYKNVYDMSFKHYIGNTAMVRKGLVCTSLASSVCEFKLDINERITRYVSTVGNSAVPYGWMQTNKGYYALESFTCMSGFIPIGAFDESQLPDIFVLNCWTEGDHPFTQIQAIPTLQIVIPRKE
jgi:hypothetical protein